MRKKVIHLLLFSLLSLGTIFISFTIESFADSDTTKVTYHYVDWDHLSSQQQQNLIKGTPQNQISFDEEHYLLVYQKAKAANEQAISTTKNNPSASSKNSSPDVLPKTGIQINRTLIYGGGLLLIITLGLFIWKRKYSKNIWLAAILLSGVGMTISTPVQAETTTLDSDETFLLPKGSELTKTPKAFKNYVYVGYLYTTQNNGTSKPVSNETGQVEVRYQTVAGTSLAKPVKLTGKIGESYQVPAKEFAEYVQKEVQGLESGTFKEQLQIVTFIYEALPDAKPVTVRYVDENGTDIHPAATLNGKIGQSYDVSTGTYKIPVIGEYKLDEAKLPTNVQGVFSDQEQTVIYSYRKEAQSAKLIIRFVDYLGNPYLVPDFTTMKNGDFVALYPNLEQYTIKLNQSINGQTYQYQQKQLMSDIVINTKIGENYDLPEHLEWYIYDANGQLVPYLISLDPDFGSTGIAHYVTLEAPENHSGVIGSEEVIVTYEVRGHGMIIAAP